MKKIVFPMVVALVAAFAFSACTPTDEDTKLTKNIEKYKTYVGFDNTVDKDPVTVTFNEGSFVISYDEFECTFSGSWHVENQLLIMTSMTEKWAPGTISNDGKDLVLADMDGMVYTVSKK